MDIDPGLLARVGQTGVFQAEDIAQIHTLYFRHGAAPDGPWQPFVHAHMALPPWFQHGLDPFGAAYRDQQLRLWQLLADTQRDYVPVIDEAAVAFPATQDVIRHPGFFLRRDAGAIVSAADHVLAQGMLLQHCQLQAGDWALEYGPGFGQMALTLARLGVQVDTVDIDPLLCGAVRDQAAHFGVPLSAFRGQFGFNPRGDARYRLIWFYESFHHCLDFDAVMGQLKSALAPDGRIILAGEPIVARSYAAVPYPWGMRLHSEAVAIVRQQRWMELGFTEDMLHALALRHGFIVQRIDCAPSLFGQLFVLERRPGELHLGRWWLPPALADQWHAPEPDGRWTRGHVEMPLDDDPAIGAVELDLCNHLPRVHHVRVEAGAQAQTLALSPGASCTVRVPTGPAPRLLRIQATATRLDWFRRLRSGDRRALGVFVRRLRHDRGV